MTDDESRMTKPASALLGACRHSGFGFLSSFVIGHSSLNELCKSGSWSKACEKNEWRLSMRLKVGQRVSLAFLARGRRDALPYAAGFMIRQDGRETQVKKLLRDQAERAAAPLGLARFAVVSKVRRAPRPPNPAGAFAVSGRRAGDRGIGRATVSRRRQVAGDDWGRRAVRR